MLGKRKPIRTRPGESLPSLNFKKTKADLSAKLKHEANDDDLFSHLMYFESLPIFARYVRDYSDLSVLPTRRFFTNPAGEEISVSIEEGKTLFIRLINIGAVDADGRRTLMRSNLNGVSREDHHR